MYKYLVLFLLISFGAMARNAEMVAEYGNWKLYYYNDYNDKVCYIRSTPVLDEGKYNQRGDIYMTITSRPNIDSFDVVGFNAGYVFEKGVDATIKVGSSTINKLFAKDDMLWAVNSDADKEIVDLMQKGQRMIVEGANDDGIKTVDTYSLNGFNEAYRAMSARCER